MITIPNDAQKIAIEDATVDFVMFNNEGTTFYAFDTSRCEPPEPMVNAMAGLRLIDGPDKRLIMINHKMPMGLFNKIGDDFEIQSRTREDGLAEAIFSFKGSVDLNDSRYSAACHG